MSNPFKSIGKALGNFGHSVSKVAKRISGSVLSKANSGVQSVVAKAKSGLAGFKKDILNGTTIGTAVANAAKGAITGFVSGGPTGALAGAATGAVSGVYEGREITRAERKAAREAESYVAEPVDIGSVVSDVVQSASGSYWAKKLKRLKHDHDDDDVVSKVIDKNTGGAVSGADVYLKEHANRIRYDNYTDKLENSAKKGAKNG